MLIEKNSLVATPAVTVMIFMRSGNVATLQQLDVLTLFQHSSW